MFAEMVWADLLSFVPFKDFLTLQIEKKKNVKNGLFGKMDFKNAFLKMGCKMDFTFFFFDPKK